MDNDETGKSLLDSKVAVSTYEDALSPGMKELSKVGTDLVKTARLIFAPLQIAASFQDRFERFLSEMNERIPDDRRVDIRPEVSSQAIESMKYIEESDTLWDLFKEVLFKSADKKYVHLVHPSFVQIIKQLTRDEAFLLLSLKTDPFRIIDTLDLDFKTNSFSNRKEESSSIPLAELVSPESLGIYYSHLQSLSLVSWPVLDQEPLFQDGRQIGIRRHSEIVLTDFGELFVTACIPPSESKV
ncbi:Abi-alpha family protein [Pantoea sp. 3_1284]|uniref:Abi-alpha family protein n=1 Tax=Pantoea sp. 3_1284 TaxID=2259618 RepID=UPI000DE2C4E0|nr:Abi-alpha family protein [Pantoea sp. 3_1284]RBO11941.1 hypothetical protein DSL62_14665 [Pantoea sp. 3_1284]